MLGDPERSARRGAENQAGARRKPFELARFRVRALVHPGATAALAQYAEERVAPLFASRGKQLDDQRVVIAVGDQPRELVGFRVH